jgi:hypothetical protein
MRLLLTFMVCIFMAGSVVGQDKEVDLQMEINKTINVIRSVTGEKKIDSPLPLNRQVSIPTNSRAVRELIVARRRAVLAGAFLGQRRGPVGYRPIISFFPQGDMMTTGAIVSPDRRYVRIGISAANTGIGAVHTFNFSTGEYRTLDNKK